MQIFLFFILIFDAMDKGPGHEKKGILLDATIYIAFLFLKKKLLQMT